MDAADWLRSVPIIVGALAAIVASGTAIYGITAWRREHLGRRRIDLAEEVLALFYEAEDVIDAVLSPLGFEGEGSTRTASEDEAPEQKAARDAAFVLIERLQSRNDLFAKIRSLRYRFQAQNGRESAQPFEDLLEIRRKIVALSRKRSRLWSRQQRETLEPAQQLQLQGQAEAAERELYGCDDEVGSVSASLKRVISDIERICREVIR